MAGQHESAEKTEKIEKKDKNLDFILKANFYEGNNC